MANGCLSSWSAKDEHRKAQPLKDGLKGIKEKTIYVLFGKER